VASITAPAADATVSGTITLNARIDETTTGGGNIQAAEYRIDSGAATAMTPSDGEFNSITENAAASIETTTLSEGRHTLSVRGRDNYGSGTWGSWASIAIIVDNIPNGPAPTVTGIRPHTGRQGDTLPIVHITGTNFVTGAAVSIGGNRWFDIPMSVINARDVIVHSSTLISCRLVIPRDVIIGQYDVVVTNPDTQSGRLETGFILFSAIEPWPTVTSLTPNGGERGSTVTVTVNGTDFNGNPPNTEVRLVRAGQPDIIASDRISNSLRTTSFTIPADAALGNWTVLIERMSGHQSAFLVDGFRIFERGAMPPTITRTTPVNEKEGVLLNAPIVINFSETIETSSATVNVVPAITNASYVWNADNTQVTVTHDNFAVSTLYTVTVAASDTSGNALVAGSVPNPFRFTTGTGEATGEVEVDVPRNLMAAKSGNDVILTWSAPAAGEPAGGGYHVYRGTSPSDIGVRVGADVLSGTLTVTDPGAIATPDSYYYVVRAYSGATESGPSNVGYLLKSNFTPAADAVSNMYWISIPYYSPYQRARDIANDINGARVPGNPGTCVEVGKFDPATGATETLTWYGDAWFDTVSADDQGFRITTGESYYVGITGNVSWISAGSDNPAFQFNLLPGGTNMYWISLPYHANYTNVRAIMDHINDGLTPENYRSIEIGKFNPQTGATETLTWYGDAWFDTITSNDQGFSFAPGEGYYISVPLPLNSWQPRRR